MNFINSGDIVHTVNKEQLIVVIKETKYTVYDEHLEFIEEFECYEDFNLYIQKEYYGIDKVEFNEDREDTLIMIEIKERSKNNNSSSSKNTSLEEVKKMLEFKEKFKEDSQYYTIL